MTNTIDNAPEKVKFIHRNYPDAANDFLRYQVGVWIYRPETQPVYHEDDGRTIIGHEETGRELRVFFLLGHSSTPRTALRMARLAYARYMASLQ